ncbi:MAG: hypothetical protein JXA33_16595, partial [Anaerolineae bacterium]|nr:hypothetical protein [Anaerolineae bacterium]
MSWTQEVTARWEWKRGSRAVRLLLVMLLAGIMGLGVLGGVLCSAIPRAAAAPAEMRLRIVPAVPLVAPSRATGATNRGLTDLTASFYDNVNFTGLAASQAYTAPISFDRNCFAEDPSLGCQGVKLAPELADGLDYSARWQGNLVVPADGTYTFSLGERDAACQPATLTLLQSGPIPCAANDWPYATLLDCGATYTVNTAGVLVIDGVSAAAVASNKSLGVRVSIGWWAQRVVGVVTTVAITHTQWIFNALDFDAAASANTDMFGINHSPNNVTTPGWYTRTIPRNERNTSRDF